MPKKRQIKKGLLTYVIYVIYKHKHELTHKDHPISVLCKGFANK